MRQHKVIVVAIVGASLFAASAQTARAQATTFGELAGKVKPGRTVYVTDDAGRKVKGKISNLSASSIELLSGGSRESFPESRVQQISVRRRHTLDGALYGVLGGLALGLASSGAFADDYGLGAQLTVTGILGLGVGTAVGAAITTERPLYRAPKIRPAPTVAIAPLVSRHGAGLGASLRF